MDGNVNRGDERHGRTRAPKILGTADATSDTRGSASVTDGDLDPGAGDARTTSPLFAAARAASVAIVLSAAWTLAYLVRFDGQIPPDRIGQMLVTLPVVLAFQFGALQLAGANRHSWRHTTLQDLGPLLNAVAATGLALLLTRAVAPSMSDDLSAFTHLTIPYGVIAAYTVLAGVGLVGARVLRRVLSEQQAARDAEPATGDIRRVLLVGAGRAGVLVARELQSRPDLGIVPVGFVDDDSFTHGRRISRLDVLGATSDLVRLVDEHRIDEVIITIASADGPTMRALIARCETAGCQPLIVPGVHEIVGGSVSLNWFRPVSPEDLLGRDPVELDLTTLSGLLTGKVVVVTGAGGSIGSELARQISRFSPARLILVERSEPALWAIHRELEAEHPGDDLVPAIADVTDGVRMRALFEAHRPAAVFHAAAHKHVPMMERNPGEAIKNNTLGTRTLVDAAASCEVGHFVLISTDKAVNPTSVMGATKRLAERYVQHVAIRTGRPYVAVRFGNVLGSTGSVVPIFEQQIAAGGPVTVTDPEMRRYFMTIPEASQLVLQAAALGYGGEVLVLDMGEPVKIVDLAESMIRLSGFEPYTDIPIEFTGLRPGEKLFEELALSEEGAERTRHAKIWIGRTRNPRWTAVDTDLSELARAADRADAATVRSLIAEHVPEFVHGETGELALADVHRAVERT
jgi:FlaA1/EpsC-like NDP-sugar epimerase